MPCLVNVLGGLLFSKERRVSLGEKGGGGGMGRRGERGNFNWDGIYAR